MCNFTLTEFHYNFDLNKRKKETDGESERWRNMADSIQCLLYTQFTIFFLVLIWLPLVPSSPCDFQAKLKNKVYSGGHFCTVILLQNSGNTANTHKYNHRQKNKKKTTARQFNVCVRFFIFKTTKSFQCRAYLKDLKQHRTTCTHTNNSFQNARVQCIRPLNPILSISYRSQLATAAAKTERKTIKKINE